jgi:hypothetical protein
MESCRGGDRGAAYSLDAFVLGFGTWLSVERLVDASMRGGPGHLIDWTLARL